MEGPKDRLTKAQEKKIFTHTLENIFISILGAEKREQILVFLDHLTVAIVAGRFRGYTKSSGLKGDYISGFLAGELLGETSIEARKKILFKTLIDKDKCGLEK